MKTKMSAVCLITMLSLSACNSNSNPSATADYVRSSGNEKCLDLEKMMAKFAALSGDTPVFTQTTDISVLSGGTSPGYELNVIKDIYESDTVPQSKNYDGSKTTQNACDSIKITYKDGRADNYKITAYTEESLTMALQGSDDAAVETLEIHRISDETFEESFNVNVSYCDEYSPTGQPLHPDASGTVEVSETISWATSLPTVAVSPDFMAKVKEAQTTSEPACTNIQN